jgi:hypothetical protein
MSDAGANHDVVQRSKRSSREEAYPVVSESPVPLSPTRAAKTLPTMMPSPRDLRLTTREQHKGSIADAQSMDFNNLEDCNRSMFRDCIDGKSPLKMAPPERVPKPKPKKRQKMILPIRQETNGSDEDPSSREDGRNSDEDPSSREDGRNSDEVSRNDSANHRIESVDALTRGGLLQQKDPSEAMKRIANSLLRRADSSSPSSDDQPGSGRQSRRSGRASHPPVGIPVMPRGPSRASLGSFGGSVGDLVRFGALGASGSRSHSSSLSLGKSSVRETPPGHADAFESYMYKMKCPAPRRASSVATSKSKSGPATLSMYSPSPDSVAAPDGPLRKRARHATTDHRSECTSKNTDAMSQHESWDGRAHGQESAK